MARSPWRKVPICLTTGLALTWLWTGCGSNQPEIVTGETTLSVNGEEVESISIDDPWVQLQRDLSELDTTLMLETSQTDASITAFRLDLLLHDLNSQWAKANNDPGRLRLFNAMGHAFILAFQLGRPGSDQLAEAMLKRAHAIDANHPDTRWHLSRLRHKQGRLDEARRGYESLDAERFKTLRLHLAYVYWLQGEATRGRNLLKTHLQQHPNDRHARETLRLLDQPSPTRLTQGAVHTTDVSVGIEGQSLVQYQVHERAWTVQHQSLGFTVQLPLTWHIMDDKSEGAAGGRVKLGAPPSIGANKQWRSDTVTVWGIPLEPGERLDAFVDSYTNSFGSLDVIEPMVVPQHLPVARRLKLRRPRYDGIHDLIGEALIIIHGDMGYVLEAWGDTESYGTLAPQVDEMFANFHTL